MNHSTIDILALCDEMLLAILNKLNNMDVLYSLMNVNQKLDKLAQDATFTRSVDLVTITSNEHNNSKRSQYWIDFVLIFCLEFNTILNVLPLIHCQ